MTTILTVPGLTRASLRGARQPARLRSRMAAAPRTHALLSALQARQAAPSALPLERPGERPRLERPVHPAGSPARRVA